MIQITLPVTAAFFQPVPVPVTKGFHDVSVVLARVCMNGQVHLLEIGLADGILGQISRLGQGGEQNGDEDGDDRDDDEELD